MMSDIDAFSKALVERFADRARRDVYLAPLTTFRVGGPADWLVEPKTSDEIVSALQLASDAGVPVTMLGGGSNVLVSDEGVRGLVIRPRGGAVSPLDDTRIRADAAVTINGLVRWTINHACAGLEKWAGTPGTVGFTGQEPGTKAYASLYNPSQNTFADLIQGGTFTGSPGFSTSDSWHK